MVDNPPSEAAEDGARADRRTMLIAGIVMLSLVLVGVGSAAIFARSACDALAPTPLGVGGSASLAEPADPTIAWLTEHVGELTGVVDVAGAEALAATNAGVAVLGESASLLSPDGSSVVASVALGEGSVVGSGDTLYSLALTNELTGQVDALLPLDTTQDGGLASRTCVDTALVGSPLAFHLAADDGELLLLRVEDDGEDTEIELRDPIAGTVWSRSLESSLLPPGVLGEWTTGALSGDLAVVGRRTAPDDDSPVVTALERGDGTIRWTVDPDRLADGSQSGHPQRVEVLDAAEAAVFVGFTDEPESDDPETAPETDPEAVPATDDAAAATVASRLVALASTDGRVLWSVSGKAGERVRAAAVSDQGGWTVLEGSNGALRLLQVDADGEPIGSAEVDGAYGGLAAVGDDLLFAHGGGFVWGTGTELSAASSDGLAGLDVVAHDGGVTVLVVTPDGREQALTFRP